jgi:hypothetical protein
VFAQRAKKVLSALGRTGKIDHKIITFSNTIWPNMFCLRIPYSTILQAVGEHCRLRYISTIRQAIDDGTQLYGVEIALPPQVAHRTSGTLFFWAPPGLHHSAAYESASLQALTFLQSIFGFVIIDYSIHGLLLYRTLAQRLFPIANRGVQLARLVIAASQHEGMYSSALTASAHQLIEEMIAVPDQPL